MRVTQEVDRVRNPKNYMKELKKQKEEAEEPQPVVIKKKEKGKTKLDVQPIFQIDPIQVNIQRPLFLPFAESKKPLCVDTCRSLVDRGLISGGANLGPKL